MITVTIAMFLLAGGWIGYIVGYVHGDRSSAKIWGKQYEKLGNEMRDSCLKEIDELDKFYREKLKEMDDFYRELMRQNGLLP